MPPGYGGEGVGRERCLSGLWGGEGGERGVAKGYCGGGEVWLQVKWVGAGSEEYGSMSRECKRGMAPVYGGAGVREGWLRFTREWGGGVREGRLQVMGSERGMASGYGGRGCERGVAPGSGGG